MFLYKRVYWEKSGSSAETEMYVYKLIRQRLMDGCNRGEAAMWDTQKHRGMDEMMVGERWLSDGRRRRRERDEGHRESCVIEKGGSIQ